MQLTLITNASEHNVIGKSLTVRKSIVGVLKQDTSMVNPTFILDYDSDYLTDINYVYCSDFHRYYFIDNIIARTGSRVELVCRVDPLESFKNSILNQTVVINKQQNIGDSNLYINDGSFVLSEQTFNEIKNFQNGFSQNGEFILITAGA